MPGFLEFEIDEDGHGEFKTLHAELPAEATFIVVVGLTVPLLLADNQVGRCAACDTPVQFRPCPDNVPKVCMMCAPDWVAGQMKAN